MPKGLRTLLVIVSALVLVSFALLVINQTAGVVTLAEALRPGLGQIVLWSLVAVYAALTITPLVLLLRLRKPLIAPTATQGPEYDAYLRRLAGRLSASSLVSSRPIESREQIEAALAEIGECADRLVKANAGRVFLATAVSQSGRLDAFMVLGIQLRMVWQLAHLYAQRPTIRELFHLYANVATTAFVAGSLEDLDVSEQVAPILSASLPTLAGEVPGLRVAAGLVANSIVIGSANAFLTLRVGMVAKGYCAPLVAQPRGVVRRAAVTQATRLLGEVVANGSAKVSKAVWDASRQGVSATASGVAGLAKDAGGTVAGLAKGAGEAVAGLAKGVGDTAFSVVRRKAEHEEPQ
ncbi:MAG TPA: DUF697 domain-containing protein [Acidobacteriota bacterium]|nr:DUF697 domain-containing protein [Acidobacteriota bacterium]